MKTEGARKPESRISLEMKLYRLSKELIGGPDRDRTDDLFHAMEARSQLRHRPTLGEGLYLFSSTGCDSSNLAGTSRKLLVSK